MRGRRGGEARAKGRGEVAECASLTKLMCASSLSALPVNDGVRFFGNAREMLKTGAFGAYTVQTVVCNPMNLYSTSSLDTKLIDFCDSLNVEGEKIARRVTMAE
eukprot:766728-Hanusia_phi.AAC.2